MWNGRKLRLAGLGALVSALTLGGCVSTSSVLEVGRDTYSVSATADGYRTAASARQNAYEVAQERCSTFGKHIQVVNESTAPTRMGIDTTVSVTFRCLADNDPQYGRPDIRPVPTAVIEDRRK